MPNADSIVPNFHGTFTYGIDANGRVMVPAKWRPRKAVLFTVILWPIEIERYLLVLPPERWKAMLDKLTARSLTDESVASLERTIGSTSAQLALDSVGRLNLPEHLTRPAEIESEAVFVGRLNKFEIWSPKRRGGAAAEDKKEAANIAKQIDL